ncbi:MAG: ribosomal L7Ae/L30e/S12e/Gadd45 family protein [Erysipelotrichaceae bacterium]|nr:ribosomal L7Ae/L30e/S12e/Gadd45 family protein [Erysipelotrichaceae bacterium]
MDQLFNLLGLAKRAGKIVLGQTTLDAILKKKVHLLFIANDASDNTIKRYTDKANSYKIAYSLEFNSEYLSNAIGSYNNMVIGITDVGFADRFKELLRKRV